MKWITSRRHPSVLYQSTLAIVVGGLSLLGATPALGALGDDAEPYARVVESDDGQVTLEMCERTFRPADGQGPKIHLVSAIHIADPSFYADRQALLETYDSVLFEGVKPAGLDAIDPELDDQSKADATADRLDLLVQIATGFYDEHNRFPQSLADIIEESDPRIASVVESIRFDGWGEPISVVYEKVETQGKVTKQTIGFVSRGADHQPGGEGVNADIVRRSESIRLTDRRKKSPVGIQSRLASALHVSFQLDEMDMTGKDWINADIDIQTLQDQLAEMGEDNAMLLTMLEGSSLQAKLVGFALGFVERSPTMSSMMKLVMIDMLALIEGTDIMSEFDAMERVILHGRNEVVIDYLKAELDAHPDYDDIAILYGAAHMPGLESFIVDDLGYVADSDQWTPAMMVDIADTGMSESQVKFMRNMIKSSIEKQF
ncbi:MAG: hypothetical protein ACWA5W_09290 [Phycisphaerales bacterium]